MMPLFLFLSLSAFASSDALNVFEKTYPRDNTFCSYKGKRVEFLVRSGSKFTEPRERGYGESIFFRKSQSRMDPKLLALSSGHSDTYRLFLGTSPVCSKSHGYQIDKDTIAILLLKENKPYRDKLVIQLLDSLTLLPKTFIDTNYPVDKARPSADGFSVRTFPETYNLEMGKVKIENQDFIYQEKEFPIWMKYSAAGFEVNPSTTYDQFEFKKYFKDESDFNESVGWLPAEKKFSKAIMYHAVNHKMKKSCLLFIAGKQKLAGTELWRCQTI